MVRKGLARGSETSIQAALVTLTMLVLAMILYHFRELDDNRLTSWAWAFAEADAAGALLILALGVPTAWWLSGLDLPGPLALFIVAFSASALFWPVPEVLIDTARYFAQAKYLALHGPGVFLKEWGHGVFAWTDLPLMPFIYGMGFRAFGESRITVQIVNSLMFAGTASLTLLIGRGLWGETVGRMAGWLMLSIPYLYSQTPLMMVDVASMFFLTLTVYSYREALARGGSPGWAVFAGASGGLAILCKYSLWPMLSMLVAVLITGAGRTKVKDGMRVTLWALACGGLVAIPLLAHKSDVVVAQISLLSEFQRPGLERWGEAWISTLLYQTHPFLTLGAIGGLALAIRRLDARALIPLWPWVFVLVMGARRSRYVIPALPMLSLMGALGLSTIRDARVRRYLIALAVIGSLVLARFAFVPLLEAMPLSTLKHAGVFLSTLKTDRVRVVTVPQRSDINPSIAVPILDLYTSKSLLYDSIHEPTLNPPDLSTSPYRFTWEYSTPYFYLPVGGAEDASITAVIAPDGEAARNEYTTGLSFISAFDRSADMFSFKPYVFVYGIE